ncbi:MAG: response regulator [Bacillota bacterium]
MRVLIAEDDAAILDILTIILQGEGYEVITAKDGETAEALAREQAPHLAILDLMMPRLNGFEVTRRLRACPELAGLKIALISALSQETVRAQNMHMWVDTFLVKPFDIHQVIQAVRTLIGPAKEVTST